MSDPNHKRPGRLPILWPLAFLIPWGVVAVTLNTRRAVAHLDSPLAIMQGAAAIGLLLSVLARWRKERWTLGAYLGGVFSGALLYGLTAGLPPQWEMALAMRRDSQEETQPEEVRVAAGKIHDSLVGTRPSETRDDFIRLYAIGYLEGVIHPDFEAAGGDRNDGYNLGRSAGQKATRDNPLILANVMKAYGYHEMEATGPWQAGFEFNVFVPGAVSPRQEWWLSFVGGTKPPILPFEETQPMKAVRLKVRGYLSPRGQYGHLGMSRWQFLATSCTVLPTDPASTRNP